MIPRYRAWCKIDNTMIKPMTIQKMIHQRNSNIPLKSLYNDFVFMQFTGLLDKNGVEIYEGDILLSTASENQEDWKKWQVHFADGRFLIDYKDIPKDKRKRTNLELEDLCTDNIWLYGLKVIGNIYENHNLIEGTEEVK